MKISTTDKNETTVREAPDDIFTFPEGAHWIACWRHFDVVSQGKTESEACERLLRNLAAHCLWAGTDGHPESPFRNVEPPTAELLAEWQERHRKAHGGS